MSFFTVRLFYCPFDSVQCAATLRRHICDKNNKQKPVKAKENSNQNCTSCDSNKMAGTFIYMLLWPQIIFVCSTVVFNLRARSSHACSTMVVQKKADKNEWKTKRSFGIESKREHEQMLRNRCETHQIQAASTITPDWCHWRFWYLIN